MWNDTDGKTINVNTKTNKSAYSKPSVLLKFLFAIAIKFFKLSVLGFFAIDLTDPGLLVPLFRPGLLSSDIPFEWLVVNGTMP